MKAGLLRHRINILAPAAAQDTFGAVNGTTTFASDVAAWVEVFKGKYSGKSEFKADQFVSMVSHQVAIRYLAGVKEGMFVEFNSVKMQIIAVVNPDGLKVEMSLLCVERA